MPEPVATPGGAVTGSGVPESEFLKLTRIPIVLYFGDNIPNRPVENPGLDGMRARFEMARRWCEMVNRYGGDAKLVPLPAVGLKGNPHFPMSDLNNVPVAEERVRFRSEKRLDVRAR